MYPEDRDPQNDPDRPQLSPQAVTDRLQAAKQGDELVVNDRERVFEVVGTDRYSIFAVDSEGNEYTISQNLQTGGWSVHEDVWRVELVDPDDIDDG